MEYRELPTTERSRVNEFYKLTTYQRPVSGSDRVFVAEKAGLIYGAVRLEHMAQVQVLRGMYMHPQHLRKGIGTGLLEAIEPELARTDSFCIPRDHLFNFYGSAGFRHIKPENAPAFLSDRLKGYIQEGIPVAIMYRPLGLAS